MFKFLFALIAVLALAYFGLTFAGYKFHPENLSYYMPEKAEGSMYEIEFESGRTVKAEVLGETGGSLRVKLEGAISNVPTSLIKSKKHVAGDFAGQYLKNVQNQMKIHPLIDKGNGSSAAAKLDQGSTNFLKTIAQVDKIEQMEKMKKQIDEVKAESEKRNQLIEEMGTVK